MSLKITNLIYSNLTSTNFVRYWLFQRWNPSQRASYAELSFLFVSLNKMVNNGLLLVLSDPMTLCDATVMHGLPWVQGYVWITDVKDYTFPVTRIFTDKLIFISRHQPCHINIDYVNCANKNASCKFIVSKHWLYWSYFVLKPWKGNPLIPVPMRFILIPMFKR